MFVRILNYVFKGSFRPYVIRRVTGFLDSVGSHYFVDNATGMVVGFRWHVFLSGGLSFNLTTRIPIVNDSRVRSIGHYSRLASAPSPPPRPLALTRQRGDHRLRTPDGSQA